MIYALIDNTNLVHNVIVHDDTITEWLGMRAILLSENQVVNPGTSTYDSDTNSFTSISPSVLTVPSSITAFEFLELIQVAGGVSDTELVSAHNDANLAALWIKSQYVNSINGPSDPVAVATFALLLQYNYLTSDKVAAITQAWPVQ